MRRGLVCLFNPCNHWQPPKVLCNEDGASISNRAPCLLADVLRHQVAITVGSRDTGKHYMSPNPETQNTICTQHVAAIGRCTHLVLSYALQHLRHQRQACQVLQGQVADVGLLQQVRRVAGHEECVQRVLHNTALALRTVLRRPACRQPTQHPVAASIAHLD